VSIHDHVSERFARGDHGAGTWQRTVTVDFAVVRAEATFRTGGAALHGGEMARSRFSVTWGVNTWGARVTRGARDERE